MITVALVVGVLVIVLDAWGRFSTSSVYRSSRWPALEEMAFVDLLLVEEPALTTKESGGSSGPPTFHWWALNVHDSRSLASCQ